MRKIIILQRMLLSLFFLPASLHATIFGLLLYTLPLAYATVATEAVTAPPVATQLHLIRTLKHDYHATALAWHPDGKHLAIGGVFSKTVAIWNVDKAEKMRTFSGWPSGIGAIAYSPDGRYLAIGLNFVGSISDKHNLDIYDANTGQLIHRLVPLPISKGGTSNDVQALAFSPDSQFLVANGYGAQSTAAVYALKTGKTVATLAASTKITDAIMSLAYSPNGKFIALGRITGTLEVWDAGKWKLLKSMSTNLPSVSSVIFSPDSKYLASGTFVGQRKNDKSGQIITGTFPDDISVWNVPALNRMKSYSSSQGGGYIRDLYYTPTGKSLLAGGDGKSVEIIDMTTGKLVSFLKDFSSIAHPSLSRDGKLLAVGAGQEVRIYKMAN